MEAVEADYAMESRRSRPPESTSPRMMAKASLPNSATTEAERLEHLAAQAADFPHAPLSFWSQSFPCGQQSDCAIGKDVPGKSARAFAPATGRTATETAMTATRIARTLLMER